VGFEEDHALRSAFIRELTLEQLALGSPASTQGSRKKIPRTLVRYWHDPAALPDDVGACLQSWSGLRAQGFEFRMFDDRSAAAYMVAHYGSRESAAFRRCRHPAMRSDYLRLCFILAEGGLYVDADDVLGAPNGWTQLFDDDRLKIQPLCYDIAAEEMVPAAAIWQADLPTEGRIFYVNNNPIAAPPGHPIVRRALARATNRLLADDYRPEIQETTGPGNLTAVLAAHARELRLRGRGPDFVLLKEWDAIARTRWELSYRGDERNWRNMGRS
jgi:mannosyltransferase OCH1-like enzyme